ncbi:MAG: HAD family hydrolase [Nitrospinaceae bacterium]
MGKRIFRLLAYDFDGTLVDSKEDIALAVNLALRELGLRTLPAPTVHGYIGHGVLHLMTRALEGTGHADIGGALARFRRHYREHLMDHTQFYPNCRETIDHFTHKTQAIVSNKPLEFIEIILEALNRRDRFPSVLGGDSVKNKKPDPEGVRLLLEKHGLQPDELLFIGDSPVDIQAGKRAGAATCAVTYGLHPTPTLQAAQPDFLITSMEELIPLIA